MNLDFVKTLRKDFPQFTFKESDDFRWSKQENTIFFDSDSSHFHLLILHELSHALLGHENYFLDIELLKMESEAWEFAKNSLAVQYEILLKKNSILTEIGSTRGVCVQIVR